MNLWGFLFFHQLLFFPHVSGPTQGALSRRSFLWFCLVSYGLLLFSVVYDRVLFISHQFVFFNPVSGAPPGALSQCGFLWFCDVAPWFSVVCFGLFAVLVCDVLLFSAFSIFPHSFCFCSSRLRPTSKWLFASWFSMVSCRLQLFSMTSNGFLWFSYVLLMFSLVCLFSPTLVIFSISLAQVKVPFRVVVGFALFSMAFGAFLWFLIVLNGFLWFSSVFVSFIFCFPSRLWHMPTFRVVIFFGF